MKKNTSHNDPIKIYKFAKPFGLILDIGCGDGQKIDYLMDVDTTNNVIGIDVQRDILKNMQYRVCGDAQHLPFKSNTFDSIVCSEVLEHLPYPENCIKEIKRVLKRNGIAFFSTPILNINLPFIIRIYRRVAGIKLEGEYPHIHVFSTKRLCTMISKNLDIIKIRQCGYTAILKKLKRHSKFEKIIYILDTSIYNLSKHISIISYLASQIWIKSVNYGDEK